MNASSERALVYLGLGSNLDQPQSQLQKAVEMLSETPNIQLLSTASIYLTSPVGPQDQPDFYNTAISIHTPLSPEALLRQTQEVEKRLGRVKKRHWGERVIDIDILLYDNRQICSDALTIPHKEMANRDFVLVPLLEMDPSLSMPSGEPLSRLLENIPPEQRAIK